VGGGGGGEGRGGGIHDGHCLMSFRIRCWLGRRGVGQKIRIDAFKLSREAWKKELVCACLCVYVGGGGGGGGEKERFEF
jgi:hypothetical protein